MNMRDVYLICFAVGVLWSVATLVLGSFHFGHVHGHLHGHTHLPGMAKGHVGSGHSSHFAGSHLAALVNPSCAAIFLAWFGGVGYLLTRHAGLAFWLNIAFAVAVGLAGALLLASFLRFLERREKSLDPMDYHMTGVFGRVASPIRAGGVGELIYIRDGARRCIPARSEDGTTIARGQEVIVTGYEKGIASVRTWEAMTQ